MTHQSLAARAGVCAALALGAGACDSPSAPTPLLAATSAVPLASTVPETRTVSGRVLVHDADGRHPLAEARVFGWVDLIRSAGSTGPASTASDGRFSFVVPAGAWLRMHVAELHQPCAARVRVVEDVVKDLHVMHAPSSLGGALPAEMMDDVPLLTGTVFDGAGPESAPLAGVSIMLDGLDGDGLVVATTMTGEDGRFVLCGLRGEPTPYLFASKPGYRPFGTQAHVLSGEPVNIHLAR